MNHSRREISLDLYKIIAMYFVVLTHVINVGVLDNAAPGSVTYWLVYFVRIIG